MKTENYIISLEIKLMNYIKQQGKDIWYRDVDKVEENMKTGKVDASYTE